MAEGLQGMWMLRASELQNCPLHRIGDRIAIRPPALSRVGEGCCLVPIFALEKAHPGREGSRKLACRWEGCRGAWEAIPEAPDAPVENWDPGRMEADLADRPFLLQLPQAVALALINAGERRLVEGGELILPRGIIGQELFLVEQGSLEVLEEHPNGQHVRIATLGRGECFGEMSLLTHQAVSNSIRAIRACRLIAVPRDQFYDLLSRFASLGSVLNRLLARRLRASNQKLEQILRPGIWGNLEVFPFLSVVQSIQAGTMTGTLTITRPRGKAMFGFDRGQLHHARVGESYGEDSLVEILRWDSGTFRFQNEPSTAERNIHGETMMVLLDALRRYDELVASESLTGPLASETTGTTLPEVETSEHSSVVFDFEEGRETGNVKRDDTVADRSSGDASIADESLTTTTDIDNHDTVAPGDSIAGTATSAVSQSDPADETAAVSIGPSAAEDGADGAETAATLAIATIAPEPSIAAPPPTLLDNIAAESTRPDHDDQSETGWVTSF